MPQENENRKKPEVGDRLFYRNLASNFDKGLRKITVAKLGRVYLTCRSSEGHEYRVRIRNMKILLHGDEMPTYDTEQMYADYREAYNLAQSLSYVVGRMQNLELLRKIDDLLCAAEKRGELR